MITALFILYLLVILGSAVTAFTFYDDLKKLGLGILAPFLAYVFVQEIALYFLEHYKVVGSNAPFYYAYRILSVSAFAFIYSRVPFLTPFRKIIIFLAALFIIVTITEFSFSKTTSLLPRYMPLARGLVITSFGMFFLSSYFRLDNVELEKYWTPLLWITTGIVIFYPVISISIAFQKELKTFGEVYGIKLYQTIPQLMSLFMYSCFIYAFYLCKRKN